MRRFKERKGGMLIFTLLTLLILSLLGLSILPLSLMEFNLSLHFSDFEKAYFLAEGALEEALSELDYNWEYKGKGWTNLNNGEYKIQIEGQENHRIATTTGKIGNIKRTLQGRIEKPIHQMNLEQIKNYGIYSKGDLSLKELGDIYSKTKDRKAIVGILGDLYFNSVKKDGKAEIIVEGNIIPKQTLDPISEQNFKENFMISSNNLLDLSLFSINDYMKWLIKHFGYDKDRISPDNVTGINKIIEHRAPIEKKSNLLLNTNERDRITNLDEILIIRDYNQVFLKGVFNGLIIVSNTNILKLENHTTINGMLIYSGSCNGFSEFKSSGDNITINGNLLLLESSITNENLEFKINHSLSNLDHLTPYLIDNINIGVEEGNRHSIKLISWKEIKLQDE